jgi:type I restriction enzyme S subunit
MNWKLTKLSEFLTERDGRIKCQSANQLGLQRIKKIDFSGNIHLDAETDTKTDMIRVKSGDLVVSGINAAKGAIAVHAEDDDVLATIHYSAYEFNPDRISVDFLKWFFKSSEFSDLLRDQIPGGIKTELKPKHILPLQVKIPKLSEQIKVAERLNRFRVDQLKLEHEIAHQQSLLAKLKQAILQEAIQGKLTADWRAAHPVVEPASQLLLRIQAEKARLIADKKIKAGVRQQAVDDGQNNLSIPAGWEFPHLDDVSMFVTDGTHQTPTYTLKGRIFLSAQNVKPFKFMPEQHKFVSEKAFMEYTNNRKAEKGDLLLGRVGAGIGETAVVDRDLDFAFYVSLGMVKTFKEYTFPQYLAIVFNSPYGIRYARGNTSSKGGSAGNFNLGRIRSFRIPFPPLAEQAAIVERVDELMTTCRALEAEIEQARTHAADLLQAVLKEAFAPATT